MSEQPTPSLPAQPSLEQQRKLAKALLRAYHAGDDEAGRRVRSRLPDKGTITLADAQFVLAREYGFQNWGAMKAHIEALTESRMPPAERFRAALRRGDAGEVRRLLECHAEVRAAIDGHTDDFGATAVVAAASRGFRDVIDALLDHGADPNRRSDWWAGGWHALHWARGELAEHLVARGELAEHLVARGATPDACGAANMDRLDLLRRLLDEDPARVHERGGDGQTPLHFARSREVADYLLDRGADIDARDVDHRATPAQWMLDRHRRGGRYDLARYLVVERGATADVFLAAALGLEDRLRAMLRENPALLDLRTTTGDYGQQPPSSYHVYMWTIGGNLSPLQVAAQFEQAAALDVILQYATPKQRFLAACAAARAEEAQAMLRSEPGLMDDLSEEDRKALPDAAWAGNDAAVALMLDLGFDPFTPGMDTGTVLHCAAWGGSVACVEAVLRHPAAKELIHRREATHHSTPLGWCFHGSRHCANPAGDYPRVATLLLEAGSEVGPNQEDATDEVWEAVEAWRAGRGPA